ncbi:unnamed protein product [Blepharisma stoltei]|uniref:Mitochondrial carrier protein n=1 Tax=Blepharisma stoltei TaxID=1481888 RepID=A0AAU9IZW3_9CILI|nr:unnamed protein product [Blepharisma stoltei]
MTDILSTFYTSLIAGGFAGCAVEITLFPLDTIKTRLQVQANIQVKNIKFFKGLSWAVAASFPCSATFWASYCTLKHILESNTLNIPQTAINLYAGIFGSFCASVMRNPFELIKQQMQTGMHRNAINAPIEIVRNQGLFGLYTGLIPMIFREVPFETLQIVLYEHLKSSDYLGLEMGLHKHLIDGAIAGAVAAYITTPIDVVKTRLMTDGGKGIYSSFIQAIKLIYKKEGIKALWTGWEIRLAYITIGGMIFFGSYEEFFLLCDSKLNAV